MLTCAKQLHKLVGVMGANGQFLLTKIVATIGPASQSPKAIEQMILAGARGFRLNLSHGTLEEHAARVKTIRHVSKDLGIPVAIFADLCGPRIRIGMVPEAGIELQAGQTITISDGAQGTGPDQGVVLHLNSPQVISQVQPGHRVLIDDGSIRLVCNEKRDDSLVCTVQVGGRVTSNKGVNLPDTHLSIPALTERDRQHVRFAVDMHLDYIALSFVQTGQDVKELKDELTRLGARPSDQQLGVENLLLFSAVQVESDQVMPIISKIERPQAVANLDSILEQTDAVMIARGDLGVEMDLAEVPVIQKRIIQDCKDYGIPVIVATQMLQSMVTSPNPTRAEVSDVANAIFDGADAVMLSAETSVGANPVEAVRMMNRIAQKTHSYILAHKWNGMDSQVKPGRSCAKAIAHGVRVISGQMDIPLLAVWSELGGGAVYLSQQRIPRPILALSTNKAILQRLALLYGLTPVPMPRPTSLEDLLGHLDRICLEKGWARAGDCIAVVTSQPMAAERQANLVCLHHVGLPNSEV